MFGKHVAQCGVELEGWWKSDSGSHPIKIDGSVEMSRIRERLNIHGRDGEKASPAFSDLGALTKWLYKEYPDRRNSSCGFHVNISLTNRSLLAGMVNKEIHDAMVKAMVAYVKTLRLGYASHRRVIGQSFCNWQFNSFAKYSAINWSKIVYYGLNYIEVRFFTQVMPPTKALKTVKFLVGLIDFAAELKSKGAISAAEIEMIANYRLSD